MLGDASSLLSNLAERAQKYRRTVLRLFYLWLAVFCVTTTLPLEPDLYRSWNFSAWLGHSIAQYLLRWLETTLLPKGETIIIVAPFDPLIVLSEIGAATGVLVVGTYALIRLARFAWPGMYPKERYWATRLLALVPVLLVTGTAVGFVVLPYIYLWAYQLALYTGAAPTVSLTEFISTTLIFALSVGASFEAPVVVAGLTAAGILSTETMRRHWRGIVFSLLILAFLISPGIGGGWIEIPLWGTFCGLFYSGYRIAKRIEQGREHSTPEAHVEASMH